jgi:hypothetical protein
VPKARTAEDMRHSVGVPALGQHGYRDDAADSLAEPPGLADRVHDLAQQVLVSELLASLSIASALHEIAPEAIDFIRRHCAEFLIERIPGFELFAVDQQCARPGEPVPVVVVIAEQLEPAADIGFCAVLVCPHEPRDEVVNQL